MIPLDGKWETMGYGIPRASGDDPIVFLRKLRKKGYSPRERG